MVGWQEFCGWMKFNKLTESHGLESAFTIAYRLTDVPDDPWTVRLNAFKRKKRTALRGGAAVMKDAVPGLVRGLGLDTSKTVFIPALSSGETVASPDGVLWLLARYAAQCGDVGFEGDGITKKAHEPLRLQSDAASRRAILAAADFSSKKVHADNVLILDDFITRGTTMVHIAGAILKRNPGIRIFAIALGKTERRSYWREKLGVELSNEHVPPQWTRSWIDAT